MFDTISKIIPDIKLIFTILFINLILYFVPSKLLFIFLIVMGFLVSITQFIYNNINHDLHRIRDQYYFSSN